MGRFGYLLMSNPDLRRGLACLAMGELNADRSDFEEMDRMCPDDPDAMKECDEVERQSASDSIDAVPQYSVAQIQEETITLDFIKKMIEDFKNQKPLDKRVAYEIIKKTREVLRPLPSLVDITVTDGNHLTVCGYVHGQGFK